MSIFKIALLLPNIVLFVLICLAAGNPLGILYEQPENFEANCTDFQGQIFQHGLRYVPGPNVCSCVSVTIVNQCGANPSTVTPKRCYNISVGERCCEYTCLDDPSIKWNYTSGRRRSFAVREAPSSTLTVGLAAFSAIVSALAASRSWSHSISSCS